MRWGAKKRIEFIETRLFWDGRISRKDLVKFFDISIPQATKDIKEYIEIAPENIRYDSSAKHYVATGDFNPKISSQTSEAYLTRLRLLQGRKDRDNFFNGGYIPPFSEMPRLGRFVDIGVLRNLLLAIHHEEAIKITYQSMSSPSPNERWITPHSLGHDGSRWHVRSFCHISNLYKDFNLGRILSINETQKHVFDHSIDYEWHNEIAIKLAPNSTLTEGQRACIERDYGMEGGQTTLNIKAAFFYYFKLNFGFRDGHEEFPCNEQQIILLNSDEITAKIDLLKSMTKNKIEEKKGVIMPEGMSS